MMAKMILLQPQPRAAFHRKMMRCVMKHVVADITEDQSGKRARCKAREDQQETAVEKKSEWHADTWRHDEPPPIVWIIVMHAVDDVVQPFSQARLGLVMKDVPVDDVFEQGPEQNT